MQNGKKKLSLMLLLIFMICLTAAVPASAKSKGYVKAYKSLLEKGEITITTVYKYIDDYGQISNEEPFTNQYNIAGFRLLNIDRKGAPEMVLQLQRDGDDSYRTACVIAYKGGKAVILKGNSSPSSTYTFGKVAYHTDKKGNSDYDAMQKKANSCFYYSKSQKALYAEVKYTDESNYDSKGKLYSDSHIYKTLYTIKSGTLLEKRFASKYTDQRGFRYYTVCDNHKKTQQSYYNAKLYNKYVKKYFRKLKKYTYYKLSAANIKKYVK